MITKILLLSLLAFGSLALFRNCSAPGPAGSAAGSAERLPADWREKTQPSLRMEWDELEGRPAPMLDGITHWRNTTARNWKDFVGKVVVLDYWATWCGPCMRGVPKLKQLQERYADAGLVVLGVHSQSGFNPAEVDSVAEANAMNYPLAADPEGRLARMLGVKFLPSYFVVDRQGVMRVAGAARGKLEEIVKVLLEEEHSARTPTTTGERVRSSGDAIQ